MDEEITETTKPKRQLTEAQLEQLAKAREKANSVRKQNAERRKKEKRLKEIQKQVQEEELDEVVEERGGVHRHHWVAQVAEGQRVGLEAAREDKDLTRHPRARATHVWRAGSGEWRRARGPLSRARGSRAEPPLSGPVRAAGARTDSSLQSSIPKAAIGIRRAPRYRSKKKSTFLPANASR